VDEAAIAPFGKLSLQHVVSRIARSMAEARKSGGEHVRAMSLWASYQPHNGVEDRKEMTTPMP
jgi:hypothetical protein